ncbi:MAG: hypothetical protein ABI615_02300 [Chthoniobacterales bacterium]
MIGATTICGRTPRRYVSPPDSRTAKAIMIGTQRFFDYGNHENIKKVALLFFHNGEPFEPHISELISDLADIRTMRNSSAHIVSHKTINTPCKDDIAEAVRKALQKDSVKHPKI